MNPMPHWSMMTRRIARRFAVLLIALLIGRLLIAPGSPAAAQGDPARQAGPCPPLDTSPQPGNAAPGPGPWLLYTQITAITYPMITTLSAIAADGAAIEQVVAETPDALPLAYTAGPGGLVAYLTLSVTDAPWSFPCPTLHLLDLATGERRAIARLTSDAVETAADMPNDAKRAITEVDSLAWSPDGSRLAFIAALGETGADLYLYDVAADSITRLTDEPDHAALPTWSPDGAFVVYQEMRTFGTGAGYAVEHLWAAAADGSGVVDLLAVGQDAYTGGEVYVGWTDSGELVFHDFINQNNLRRADPAAGQTVLLREACFDDAALDPASGTTLVVLHPAEYGCDMDAPPGAFLIAPDGTTVQAVERDSFDPVWSAADGRFYTLTYGSGSVAVAPPGQAAVVAAPDDAWGGTPLVSPDGSRWAWSGSGLWVGPYGEAPVQIDAAIAAGRGPDTRFITWTPVGNRLYYVADEDLYTAAAPDFAVALAVESLQPYEWFWAAP